MIIFIDLHWPGNAIGRLWVMRNVVIFRTPSTRRRIGRCPLRWAEWYPELRTRPEAIPELAALCPARVFSELNPEELRGLETALKKVGRRAAGLLE
jgi:hypothetical protein